MISIELLILFKGIIAGFFYSMFSIAGMLLVSQYAIQETYFKGFVVSFGIITIQLLYTVIAILILSFTFHLLHPSYKMIAIIGAIILFIMALKTYRERSFPHFEEKLKTHLWSIFGSGSAISLTLPIRILGYLSIFAALGIYQTPPTLWGNFSTLLGVFLGTLLWWLIFLTIIHKTKEVIPQRILQRFHKLSASILIAFSVIGLLQMYI